MKKRIIFHSSDDVKNFVTEIAPLNTNFDIMIGKGAIDAKSLLGVLAVDLSKPLELSCVVADGEMDKVEAIIKKYEV